jgi:hypothetical protein
VSTSNDDGRLTNGLPLRVSEHGPVFVSEHAPHGGLGEVAGGNTNIGVILVLLESPEDRHRILGGAVNWPRVTKGR